MEALPAALTKMPGIDFSYKAIQKSFRPFKVQPPLPIEGLQLYQMGVHIWARSYLIVKERRDRNKIK